MSPADALAELGPAALHASTLRATGTIMVQHAEPTPYGPQLPGCRSRPGIGRTSCMAPLSTLCLFAAPIQTLLFSFRKEHDKMLTKYHGPIRTKLFRQGRPSLVCTALLQTLHLAIPIPLFKHLAAIAAPQAHLDQARRSYPQACLVTNLQCPTCRLSSPTNTSALAQAMHALHYSTRRHTSLLLTLPLHWPWVLG